MDNPVALNAWFLLEFCEGQVGTMALHPDKQLRYIGNHGFWKYADTTTLEIFLKVAIWIKLDYVLHLPVILILYTTYTTPNEMLHILKRSVCI